MVFQLVSIIQLVYIVLHAMLREMFVIITQSHHDDNYVIIIKHHLFIDHSHLIGIPVNVIIILQYCSTHHVTG